MNPAAAGVTSTGSTAYVSVFIPASNIGDSPIYVNSGDVGISARVGVGGSASSNAKLNILGSNVSLGAGSHYNTYGDINAFWRVQQLHRIMALPTL